MVLASTYQGQSITRHSSAVLLDSRSFSPFARGSAQTNLHRSIPCPERAHHEHVIIAAAPPAAVTAVHKTQVSNTAYLGRVASSSMGRRSPPRRHGTMTVVAPPPGSMVTNEAIMKKSSVVSVPPPSWNSGYPKLKPTVHHGVQNLSTPPVMAPMSEHTRSGPFNVSPPCALSTGASSTGQAHVHIQGNCSTILGTTPSAEMNYYQDLTLPPTPINPGTKMRCGATTEDVTQKQSRMSVSQPETGHARILPRPSVICCVEPVSTPAKSTKRRIQETRCFESPCSISQPVRSGIADPLCGATHTRQPASTNLNLTEDRDDKIRHAHDRDLLQNKVADDAVAASLLEAPLKPPMPRWNRHSLAEEASTGDGARCANEDGRRCSISCNRACSDASVPDVIAPPLLGGRTTNYSRHDGPDSRAPPRGNAVLAEPAFEVTHSRPSNRVASPSPVLPPAPPSLGATTKVTNFVFSNDASREQQNMTMSQGGSSRDRALTCEASSTIVVPVPKAVVDAVTQTESCHIAPEMLRGEELLIENPKASAFETMPLSCEAKIVRSVERKLVSKDRIISDAVPRNAPLTKTAVPTTASGHERQDVRSENLRASPIKSELATIMRPDDSAQDGFFAEVLPVLPMEAPRREHRPSTTLSEIVLDPPDAPNSVSNSPLSSSFGWTPPAPRLESGPTNHSQDDTNHRKHVSCLDVKCRADSPGNRHVAKFARLANEGMMVDSPVSKYAKKVADHEGMMSKGGASDIASTFCNEMCASSDVGSLMPPLLDEKIEAGALSAVIHAANVAAAADAARGAVLDAAHHSRWDHADVNDIAETSDMSITNAATTYRFKSPGLATARDAEAKVGIANRVDIAPLADVVSEVVANWGGASRASSPKTLSPDLGVSTGVNDTSCSIGYPPLHALRQRASALSRRLLEREQQCLDLKSALEVCGLSLPDAENVRPANGAFTSISIGTPPKSNVVCEEAMQFTRPGTLATNICRVGANACNSHTNLREPLAPCDTQPRVLSPQATAATQM